MPVTQRPRVRDRMAHRRLLHIGRHDPDAAEFQRGLRERRNARAVNPIIVDDQNFHPDRIMAFLQSRSRFLCRRMTNDMIGFRDGLP